VKLALRSKELRFMVTALGASLLLAALAWWSTRPFTTPPWTDAETALLRSLWLESLGAVPEDPSNAVADDPRAARFGETLFFDTRLSGNGQVACATCHEPPRRFTDGRPKGRAIGMSKRNTMSLIGAAYSPWLYWDGRKDSLWSQALSPLEDPNEQAGNRMAIARLIARIPDYRAAYEALFGPLPDFSDTRRFPPAAAPNVNPTLSAAWHAMKTEDREAVTRVFVNVGKALAAYERRLLPSPSRFDRYVQAVLDGGAHTQAATLTQETLTQDETRGLRLFIGEAGCIQCHNGPLFTNNEFHNTGVLSSPGEVPDQGRVDGIRLLRADPFNCLSEYSDAPTSDCPELRFARDGVELIGAVRTPSLRNLEGTAPYMHKGQMTTFAEILDHYNRAPLAMIGHNEAKPLSLSQRELRQLEEFLSTLAAPVAGGATDQPSPER
jgi:cytochrome c peroxidase